MSKKDDKRWILDRRAFLHASVATGSAMLWACSDDAGPDAGMDAGPDAGMDAGADIGADAGVTSSVFDMFEQLQAGLRGSPDHRVARAQRLVDAKDLEGLHAFVRDEIVLYPGFHRAMEDTEVARRWGWRATLRGGGGTMREKAELLEALCTQAGFTAALVSGRWMERPADAKAFLFRDPMGAFEPAITEDEFSAWRQQFTDDAPVRQVPRIDEDGAQSSALADALIAQIPDPAAAVGLTPTFDFRVRDYVPIVRVERDGQSFFANPIRPDAAFGTSYLRPEDEARPAPAPDPLLEVEVTLSAATTLEPDTRIVLANKLYTADELAGRQLVVQTAPTVSFEAQATTSFSQVRSFLPSMVLQSFDLDATEAEALSVVGEAFTASGEVIDLEEDGTVRIGGQVVVDPSNTTDPNRVSSVEIDKLNAGAFPEVKLEMTLKDSDGNPVAGLPASAFELREDGEPLSFMVRRNTRQPRAIVITDNSLSMPTEFRGENGRAFAEGLRDALVAEEPNTQVEFVISGSDLWTALSDAAQKNPTVIIYLTDGDVGDALTPEIQAILENGPPAVLLKVRDSAALPLDEMAMLTGGVVLLATEVPAAITAAADYIRQQTLSEYLLTYEAPRQGPATRSLSVRVVAPDASASGSYQVPATPALPQRIAGLYLEVRVGNQTVERTLAGRLPFAGVDVREADVADVRNALFGQYWVSFEAGMPSTSIWLDDLLSAKLTARPLFEAALAEASTATLIDTYNQGFKTLPPDLFAAQTSLREDTGNRVLAFEDGLRVTMYSERPVLGTAAVRRSLDILPTSRISVASEASTEAERLREALRITARLAVGEKALYGEDTIDLLAGKALLTAPRGDSRPYSGRADVDAETQLRWRALLEQNPTSTRLVPEDAAPFAYWSIENETGALLGILKDGSGGGTTAEGIMMTLRELDKIIAHINLLAGAAGAAGAINPVGGVALSVVAAYGQTLARLYGAVTLTIANLDASGLDAAIRQAIISMVCNIVKSLFLGVTGSPGAIVSALDNVLTLLIDNNPFGCP